MAISTWLVVGDAFTFFGFLLLCLWELFVVTSLSDLESDILPAKDLCEQLNPFFVPVYVAHFFVSLLALICGKYVQFIVQLPVIVFHARQYLRKKVKLDFMSIRRSDELKRQFQIHYIFIATNVIAFLWSFVTFAVFNSIMFILYFFSD